MLERNFTKFMKREGLNVRCPEFMDYGVIVEYKGQDRFVAIEDVYGVTEEDWGLWFSCKKSAWDKGDVGSRAAYDNDLRRSTRVGAHTKRRIVHAS